MARTHHGESAKLRVYLVEDSGDHVAGPRALIEAVGAKIVGNSARGTGGNRGHQGAAAGRRHHRHRPVREGNGFDVLKALFTETGAAVRLGSCWTNHADRPVPQSGEALGRDLFLRQEQQILKMPGVVLENAAPAANAALGVVTQTRARRSGPGGSSLRDRRHGVTTRSRPSFVFAR